MASQNTATTVTTVTTFATHTADLRRMAAKFPGKCRQCAARFAEGADILWSRERGSFHYTCVEQPAEQANAASAPATQAAQPQQPQARLTANDVAAKFAERLTDNEYCYIGESLMATVRLTAKQINWLVSVGADRAGRHQFDGQYTRDGRHYNWTVRAWPNGAGYLTVAKGYTEAEANALSEAKATEAATLASFNLAYDTLRSACEARNAGAANATEAIAQAEAEVKVYSDRLNSIREVIRFLNARRGK